MRPFPLLLPLFPTLPKYLRDRGWGTQQFKAKQKADAQKLKEMAAVAAKGGVFGSTGIVRSLSPSPFLSPSKWMGTDALCR